MTTIYSTPQTEELVPIIEKFIADELFQLETPENLSGNFSKVEPKLYKLREKVKAMGLWGLALPKEVGGRGLTLCEFGQISEALAKSPFGHFVFNSQAPDIGNMELMHKYANESLQEKYLEPLMKGEIRSCFSMTEPEFAGSNPTRMGTTAIKDGDNYVINGHKWFTSSADGAAFAIVMAVTNPEAPRHKQASQILVPLDTKGYEFVRNIPIMGHTGDSWASHAEVRYNDVVVTQSNLIGAEGSGFLLAQERLGPGRIHHCMRFIGISERAFDLMVRYAISRELREGTKLAHMQSIQNFIAESRAEINAARLMVLDTAHKIDLHGSAAVRNEISTIKFFTANMMLRVIDRAIQTHGALGMTSDVILSYWYAHERAARIYDGADEVHKAALARSIFKNYDFDVTKK